MIQVIYIILQNKKCPLYACSLLIATSRKAFLELRNFAIWKVYSCGTRGGKSIIAQAKIGLNLKQKLFCFSSISLENRKMLRKTYLS